jgi:hypothetical protein
MTIFSERETEIQRDRKTEGDKERRRETHIDRESGGELLEIRLLDKF